MWSNQQNQMALPGKMTTSTLLRIYCTIILALIQLVPMLYDKTRLLKVSISCTQEKSSILSKCYKLRNSDNPSSIQKIFVTPDLTPLEQKKDKLYDKN